MLFTDYIKNIVDWLLGGKVTVPWQRIKIKILIQTLNYNSKTYDCRHW